jgi:protein-L-isoaspartate(D-aspartate) O-methyltransferase
MMMAVRRALLLLVLAACSSGRVAPEPSQQPPPSDPYAVLRRAMVSEQLEPHGIRDPRVLDALRKVPRHEFVRPEWRENAYDDRALPIDAGQTISQPYIVALMSELADLTPGERVLEVGTGSGYQAAVLAELVGAGGVYSIEIVAELARGAAARLGRLGYGAIHLREGDGYRGWPEAAPFHAVLVTAAPPSVPPPLEEQLAVGGRLVIPVGDASQELLVITRTAEGLERRSVIPVAFVPMTGEARGGAP